MGYYVRAFCTNSAVPSLNSILQWLESLGKHLELDQQIIKVDSTSTSWEQAALIYKNDKLPILVECNRDTGSEECLMRKETNEFLKLIGKPGLSLSKRKVIEHLKQTRYIIACQLPTSNIDDDGYEANHYFLFYFVKKYSGIIQADGEGFYKGNKIIVKL